jgi:hypothetical protein
MVSRRSGEIASAALAATALIFLAMCLARGRGLPSLRGARFRAKSWATGAVLASALALGCASCGGGGGSSTVAPDPATLPGIYTLTVTGTSGGSPQHQISLTLTVTAN